MINYKNSNKFIIFIKIKYKIKFKKLIKKYRAEMIESNQTWNEKSKLSKMSKLNLCTECLLSKGNFAVSSSIRLP